MASIHNDVIDAALLELQTADAVYLCNAEPTTYAEANATFRIGDKATPTIGAPAAGTPDGRQIAVAAFTDGDVTVTGTGTHYALVDTVNSKLLAVSELANPQAFTSGNLWTAAEMVFRIPAVVVA